MTRLSKLICILIPVILILIFSVLFTVREGSKALLLQLGQLEKDAENNPIVFVPGLHLKMPFITKVLTFDARTQNLDVESSRIVTSEKKDVLVDYYVKWRIHDMAKYYKSTGGNIARAQILLRQQVNNSLRAQFGGRTISEVVTDDRLEIMSHLRDDADHSAAPLGIDIIDVRIQAIDLPREVSEAVFSRMQAERQRVATEHRAKGKSLAEAIKAQADAKATIILAKAKKEAATVMAMADHEAAKIYANAYNQDPKFYEFYRSLKAYNDIFKKNQDMLVLSADSPFFKYMKNKTMKPLPSK